MRSRPSGIIKEILADWNVPSAKVNDGMCHLFAEELVKRAGRGKIYQFGIPSIHAFVVIGGRYYDAETPEGAERWKDLGYFREQHSVVAIEKELQ